MSRRRQLIAKNSTPQWMKDAADTYGLEIANLKQAMIDYMFVEYLQNTDSKQYIDTEVSYNKNIVSIITSVINLSTSSVTTNFVYGAFKENGGGATLCIVDSTHIRLHVKDGVNFATYSIDELYSNVFNIIKYTNNAIWVNNKCYNISTNVSYLEQGIWLFKRSHTNVSTPMYGSGLFKIGSHIFMGESSAIQVLMSCLRKSDNKPIMLDLVTMKEYVNKGTGADFIYGDEVTLESKFAELSA